MSLHPTFRRATLVAALMGPAALTAQSTGTVRGRVTESESRAPVPSAQVIVVGTRIGAQTRADGDYQVPNVPAGEHTIRVVRIGYAPQTRTVTVPAGGEVTADFALTRAAARLEEVVTTATGEQERRAIGNVIGTISADSIAALRPIVDVTQVLAGRTPGLNVIMGAGMVGSGPVIAIRGVNSLSLRNDPLVIIDGIRMESGASTYGLTTVGATRLSEINPQEIESIDVIKGPSAAALYGTAAANGVLVIKTKRGRSGEAQWRPFGEVGQLQQVAPFPDNLRSWGRIIDPGSGLPGGDAIQCLVNRAAEGECMIDSLTRFNPLRNPATTPYKDQPRYMGGLQVSGGNGPYTYFLSGQYERERGPFEMPRSEISRLTELRGTKPLAEQVHPNQLGQYSLRANFGTDLGSKATATISAGYLDRDVRTPFDNGYFQGLTWQTIMAPGYRTEKDGNILQYTGDIFSVNTTMESRRFIGSLSTTYAPFPWLSLRGVAGLDQSAAFTYTLQRNGEGVVTGWGNLIAQNGGKDGRRETALRYSYDAGATATWELTPALNLKTAAGAQFFKDASYLTQGDGFDLLPGATTWTSAARRTTYEQTVENSTYGAYLEETASWRDRLYLTGGVRTDKNSAFGFDQGNVLYPRANLSWVISEESFFPKISALGNARLRAAWGKAGVQPSTTAALQYLKSSLTPVGGVETPALELAAIGNARLKPETTTETELGTDLGFFGGRLGVEATWFNKESKDALISVSLPPSVAAGTSQFRNLGKVRNRGVELAFDVEPLRTPTLGWSFRLSGSSIKNKIVTLGDVPITPNQGARDVPGYAIQGLWARPILGFSDANGDGILVESEIQVGDSLAFRGPQLPTKEASLTNTFALFRDRVHVVAQFDYRGGHYSQWLMENNRCVGALNCRAVNDPSAPLADQAAAVVANSPTFGRSNWGYYQKKDYIRMREIAVTFSTPRRLASLMRARDASITLSGRNVWLVWTDYPGLDPENNYTFPGFAGVYDYDWFTMPPVRYWIARINLSL